MAVEKMTRQEFVDTLDHFAGQNTYYLQDDDTFDYRQSNNNNLHNMYTELVTNAKRDLSQEDFDGFVDDAKTLLDGPSYDDTNVSAREFLGVVNKIDPDYTSRFEHRDSPSTLENMSKAELINQIHCLVNDNDALQERVQNQADYLQKLIELIEPAHDEKPTKYFYFSFGSNDKFPYKNGYVVVKAKNELEATKEFKQHCPNRPETDYINCAFIYPQQEWNEIPPNFKGKCHAVFQNGTITGANPDLSYLEEKEYSERE